MASPDLPPDYIPALDLVQVISDDKHYRPFVCCLCIKLVSISHPLVSNDHAHVYCQGCLQEHVYKSFAEHTPEAPAAGDETGSSNNNLNFVDVICPQSGKSLVEGNEEDDDELWDLVDEDDFDDDNSRKIRIGRKRRQALLGVMEFNTVRPFNDEESVVTVSLRVQPLQEAQPLAYQCLGWVQVAILGNEKERCHWAGNYDLYPQQRSTTSITSANKSSPASAQTNASTSTSGGNQPGSGATTNRRAMPPRQPSRGNLREGGLKRTQSMPVLVKIKRTTSVMDSPLPSSPHDDILNSPTISNDSFMGDRSPSAHQPTTPPMFFRKSASMRDLTRDQRQQQQQLPMQGVFSQRSPAVPRWESGEASSEHMNKMTKKINDPLALSGHMPRNNNNSTAGDTANSIMARDLPPSLVKRSKSSNRHQKEVIEAGVAQQQQQQRKAVPEDKRLSKQQRQNSAHAIPKSSGHESKSRSHSAQQAEHSLSVEDPEVIGNTNGGGSSSGLDPNTSINSLTAWGANNSSTPALQSLSALGESKSEQAQQTSENGSAVSSTVQSESTADRERVAEFLARAEKLKKQANAKFNKGDFNSARTMYTQGIKIMSVVPRIGPKEGEMLSNMHSNRAVTYFREKDFISCLQDCDVAIQYDPYYEKSWIRKWRAMMALGKFQTALECLENGAISIPESTKIRKELEKARAEMELVQRAKELLQGREYRTVKDMLKDYMSRSNGGSASSGVTDNLELLHLTARADAYMGSMESAMDKVNRALRYNPNQPDGLAVRGSILYLAGETEKGLHLLQDAYGRDKENKAIKQEVQQCHRTHSSLSKGRNCVKRGRYLEAMEHFTAAMKEKTLVPEKTPLFAMVRCERAEAWMLSQDFIRALKDCEDVIAAQSENATAWTVRAEILIALDKAHEAQEEMTQIRKSWGADDPTIEEGYRRVDFEMRVLKAEQELDEFVMSLEENLGQIRPVKDSKRRYSDESGYSQQGNNKRNGRRSSGESDRRSSTDSAEKSPLPSGQRRPSRDAPEYKRQGSGRRLSGEKRATSSDRKSSGPNDEPATPGSVKSRQSIKDKRRTGHRRSASSDRLIPISSNGEAAPKSPHRQSGVRKSRSSRKLSGVDNTAEPESAGGNSRRKKLERKSHSSRGLSGN